MFKKIMRSAIVLGAFAFCLSSCEDAKKSPVKVTNAEWNQAIDLILNDGAESSSNVMASLKDDEGDATMPLKSDKGFFITYTTEAFGVVKFMATPDFQAQYTEDFKEKPITGSGSNPGLIVNIGNHEIIYNDYPAGTDPEWRNASGANLYNGLKMMIRELRGADVEKLETDGEYYVVGHDGEGIVYNDKSAKDGTDGNDSADGDDDGVMYFKVKFNSDKKIVEFVSDDPEIGGTLKFDKYITSETTLKNGKNDVKLPALPSSDEPQGDDTEGSAD